MRETGSRSDECVGEKFEGFPQKVVPATKKMTSIFIHSLVVNKDEDAEQPPNIKSVDTRTEIGIALARSRRA